MTKLIDKLSFLLTPNGYKAGSLYPYKPLDNRPAYAWLPGVSGNYFSTPNATANQVTGNIQITANINTSVLTSDQNIVNKSSVAGTTMGYNFYLNSSGGLSFAFSPTGSVASRTTVTSTVSLASVGILPNTNFWVRVTRNSVSGDIQFFTSIDGVIFTQLGSTVSSITGNLFSSTEPLFLGTWADVLYFLTGKINRVTISNSIGGNPVVDFNPASYSRATSGTTWTSTTGEVWTLNGTLAYIKEALLNIPFTRNSLATRLNQSGNIETVQANVPRIHYPVPNQCPVLLMEPQRTNLALWSEDFTQWSLTRLQPFGSGSVSNTTQTLDPFNSYNADYLKQQTGNTTFGGVLRSFSVTSGLTYSISVYAKKANSNFFCIVTNAQDGNYRQSWFNLQTGQVGTTNGSYTLQMQNAFNGWYRCTIIFTANATRTADAGPHLAQTDGSIVVNDQADVYATGFQIEQGSYPSSYIPTQGSTITRLADSITNLVSNYGSIAIGTKGTIHFDATMAVAPTSENFAFLFNNQYQSASNGIRLRLWSTGTWSFRDTITGSDITPNLPINARTRVTFVIDGRIVLTYINGVFYSRWTRPTPVDIQRITAMFIPSDGGILHLHELAISQDLLTPEEIAQLSNDYTNSQQLQTSFQARVSSDSGILESSSSLEAYLTSLQNINLA